MKKANNYVKKLHDKLKNKLTKKLQNNSKVLTQKNINDLLKVFKKRNWTKESTVKIQEEFKTINQELDIITNTANTRIEKMSFNFIKTYVKTLYRENKKVTSKFLKKDFIFDERDEKAVKHISKTSSFFVRDNLGKINKSMSQKAQKLIIKGVEDGLSIEAIQKQLNKVIPDGYLKNQKNYFQVVSSNAVAKAQNYSEIYTYEEAQIREYEYFAIMDEATTTYCSQMNGKIFTVKDSITRIKEEMTITPEDMLEKRPFVRQTKDKTSKQTNYSVKIDESIINIGNSKEAMDMEVIKGYGLNLPPSHHNCRSTIIPII